MQSDCFPRLLGVDPQKTVRTELDALFEMNPFVPGWGEVWLHLELCTW